MRKVLMPRLQQRVPPPFAPHELTAPLDRGLRPSEFVSLTAGNVNMRTRLVTVPGKGQKQRTVRLGAKTGKTILRYLATRQGATPDSPLWIVYRLDGRVGGLTLRGLQMALGRPAEGGGVSSCQRHRFRETFTLWCMRHGKDLHLLRLLMGHSSLAVLQRYLALAGEVAERARKLHWPVDNLL